METAFTTYKALVFDIDGTLTEFGSQQVVPAQAAAIKAAQTAGMKIIIDSGRPQCAMKLLELAGIRPDIIVACSGHVVYNQDGYVCEEKNLPLDTYRNLCDFCAAHKIGLLWKFLEGVFIQVDNPDSPWNFEQDRDVYYRCQPDPTRRPNGGNVKANSELIAKLMAHFHTKVDIISAGGDEYEICLRNVNKATGLDSALKIIGIAPEACIGFGDSDSDIEMIESVGWGVAMGDASAALKSAGREVTDTAANNGIGRILKNKGIITE